MQLHLWGAVQLVPPASGVIKSPKLIIVFDLIYGPNAAISGLLLIQEKQQKFSKTLGTV